MLVGFVLLIGILVAVLGLTQTTLLPVWNEETEIEHTKKVQQDMQNFATEITSTAATDVGETVSVKLGTSYQSLPFLFNPPDPKGLLKTGDEENVKIENAIAVQPGDANFWNGDTRQFTTRNVIYRPRYNLLKNAGKLLIENGELYHSVEGETVSLSEHSFIDGEDVTFTFLAGELEVSASSTGVGMEPEAAPYGEVLVTSTAGSDTVDIEVPTSLNRKSWNKILKPEKVENGGYVEGYEYSGDRVKIRLTGDEVYRLRMARVGLGKGSSIAETQYLSPKTSTAPGVDARGRVELAVETETRYGTAVSGETVEWSIKKGVGLLRHNGKTAKSFTLVSDEDGVSSLEYVAPGGLKSRKSAEIKAVHGDAKQNFDVTVSPTPSGGGEPNPRLNPAGPGSVEFEGVDVKKEKDDGGNDGNGGKGRKNKLEAIFNNRYDEPRKLEKMRLNFFSGDERKFGGGKMKIDLTKISDGKREMSFRLPNSKFKDVPGKTVMETKGENHIGLEFPGKRDEVKNEEGRLDKTVVLTVVYNGTEGRKTRYMIKGTKGGGD